MTHHTMSKPHHVATSFQKQKTQNNPTQQLIGTISDVTANFSHHPTTAVYTKYSNTAVIII